MKISIILILLFLVFRIVDAQSIEPSYFEQFDKSFERNKCMKIPLMDSLRSQISEFAMSGGKDTSILFVEEENDTFLVLKKKGNITQLSGYYTKKKISGDYFEIQGYRALNNIQSDTISIWKPLLLTLENISKNKLNLPKKEQGPSVKLIGVIGKNWFCFYNSEELIYNFPYDERTTLFERIKRNAKLIKW